MHLIYWVTLFIRHLINKHVILEIIKIYLLRRISQLSKLLSYGYSQSKLCWWGKEILTVQDLSWLRFQCFLSLCVDADGLMLAKGLILGFRDRIFWSIKKTQKLNISWHCTDTWYFIKSSWQVTIEFRFLTSRTESVNLAACGHK